MTTTSPSPSPWRPVRIVAVVAAILTLAAGFIIPSITPAGAQGATAELTIYDDDLAPGFQDWSWAAVDLASTERASSGSAAMRVDMVGWDALYLGHPESVAIPVFGELAFDVHGGTNETATISVALSDTGFNAGPALQVDAPGGTWTSVQLPLSDLGSFSRIGGLWWQEGTGADLAPIWIDNVRIVGGEAPPPIDGPAVRVELGDHTLNRTIVDPSSGQASTVTTTFPRPISDQIYGMNFASNSLREELDLGLNRWGGNSTERYNYETNSWNAAQDWVFANVSGDVTDDIYTFEAESAADGVPTIVTIPATGWVSSGRAPSCSYPVDEYGPQDFEANITDGVTSIDCGDGYVGGVELDSVDPTVTSIAADESWATAMVSALVDRFGPASAGGVEIYAVGNEPGLWHSTHRDIRPDPIGRAEIIERNSSYAAAIKAADPTADVIGPVLFSGYTYFVTSEEILSGLRVEDVPNFSSTYLAGMADASAQAGSRLLDTFAVNFYDDRVFSGGTDELRLDSTRSLWDTSYAPQDWWVTRDWSLEGVAAIPRLRAAIDENYPGTELAITEYNFGGADTIAGALAQIDALGIFGREGLDAATLWDPFLTWVGLTEAEHAQRPLMHAFRMFRNYDGAGSQYGDRALWAESTDEPTVSIYAAERTTDGALTILVNNKSLQGQNVPLDVAVGGTAEVYRYSADNLGGIVRVDDLAIDGGAVLELPARSATLLVITDPGDPVVGPPDNDPPPPPPTPTPDPEPTPDPTPEPPAAGIEMPVLGGGAVLIDPPADLTEGGALDSNDTSFVWLESGPFVLDRDIVLNRFLPGEFRGNSSEDHVIEAGTQLCSFRVHGDHLDDRGRLQGSASWAEDEVIGLIYRKGELRATRDFRADGTRDRLAALNRSDRLDFFYEEGDDGRTYLTVSWNFKLRRGIDGMRILTAC